VQALLTFAAVLLHSASYRRALRRWASLDTACYLLAALYALPSVWYPFGGDAAIFDYVGRAWLDGLWPYAHAADHKPPGIFAVHATVVWLFGEQQWGIRLVELCVVLVMGRLLALTLRPHERLGGLAALIVSGFYYTCFDYWRTAQVEIWQGLCLLAAWAVALRDPLPIRRHLAAGALAGLAFLFKFTAAVPALGVAGICAWRACAEHGHHPATGWRKMAWRGLSSLALFGTGTLATLGLVFAPFLQRGHFGAMWDLLVPFNLFYAQPVEWTHPFTEFWTGPAILYALLVGIAFVVALTSALRGRCWPEVGLALQTALLLALAVGAVELQGKRLAYHWGIVTPFVAAGALWGLSYPWRARLRWAHVSAILGVAIGFAFTPPPMHETWQGSSYRTQTLETWKYLRGQEARSDYLKRFTFFYEHRAAETLGEVIRAHASTGDTLCLMDVFAYPTYTTSGLRCPSRFFAAHMIRRLRTNRALAGELMTYVREHQATLRRSPPVFVVTRPTRLALPERITGRRYEALAMSGGLALLRLQEELPPDETARRPARSLTRPSR
jgi:hypothetical protein